MSTYKDHFLTNVILRIDFVSSEDQLKQELNPNVKATCIKHFPILEERKVEIQEVQINNNQDGNNTIINQESSFEWHFFGKNREKELAITSKCIFVDFKDYSNFTDFKSQFMEVLKHLIDVYPSIKLNRIGLRYIDQIALSLDKIVQKDWLSYWKKYISAPLLQGLSFPEENDFIARYMSIIEMNYGDHMLKFQYGIHNEDYPAPNKKPVFILDTDIFSVGLYNTEDLDKLLNIFHEKAKKWFEKSIKSELRKKMGLVE